MYRVADDTGGHESPTQFPAEDCSAWSCRLDGWVHFHLGPHLRNRFATHVPRTVFLIGLASAVGAGISMAFSEGLSNDGELTGRGDPIRRGAMTFVGGFLHTLPFLISNMQNALMLAYLVVRFELPIIAYVRYKSLATNFAVSCLQVVVGGALVFASGVDWECMKPARP